MVKSRRISGINSNTGTEYMARPGICYLHLCYLSRLQLQLKLIRDQGDELTIGGFSLGIADGIPEKSLQRIQIPSVPGYFDGMADGAFYSGGRGLEGFRHLGV